MWAFLKRQLRTKTGRFAATIITAAVADKMPGISDYMPAVVEAVANPQTAVIGLLGMFLRDGKAKLSQ